MSLAAPFRVGTAAVIHSPRPRCPSGDTTLPSPPTPTHLPLPLIHLTFPHFLPFLSIHPTNYSTLSLFSPHLPTFPPHIPPSPSHHPFPSSFTPLSSPHPSCSLSRFTPYPLPSLPSPRSLFFINSFFPSSPAVHLGHVISLPLFLSSPHHKHLLLFPSLSQHIHQVTSPLPPLHYID